MTILRELAPLGATHLIQIVLDYAGENITATVLATPKDSLKIPDDSKAPRSLQFKGPIDEVETAIGHDMAAGVTAIAGFTSNMASLQAQLDADAKAATDKADAARQARTAAKAGGPAVAKTPAAAPEKPKAETGGELFALAEAAAAAAKTKTEPAAPETPAASAA